MSSLVKTSSILNDVLGPVMTGPSSSHTAGPAKIALSAHRLWGKDIKSAVITYDENGSYRSTHIGQGCDFGFSAGILGYETDDPRFRDSIENAKECGVDISIEFADLGFHHPNEAKITLKSDRDFMYVRSYSTGGGTFLIVEMDGYDINFDGQRKKYYVCINEKDGASFEASLKAIDAVYEKHLKTNSSDVLFEIEAASLKDNELNDAPDSAKYMRCAGPIAPIALKLNLNADFNTAEGALEYAKKNNISSMAELGRIYEASLSAGDAKDTLLGMEKVMRVMEQSMTPPPATDYPLFKLIEPAAEKLLKKTSNIDLGILNECVASSIAVMENNLCHRALVAAPTAGSAGIIPACIIAVGRKLGKTDADILDALWASGLVGAFIANQATFGAEVAGCQAEIGAASCMAAAGLVQLMGGSIEEGFTAANIAMQSMLGLICDPVGGLVEFPCIERNVTACSTVAMSAKMAMMGVKNPVKLDETIVCMLKVGEALPAELRCTCGGGLCQTPCAIKMCEKL